MDESGDGCVWDSSVLVLRMCWRKRKFYHLTGVVLVTGQHVHKTQLHLTTQHQPDDLAL